MEPTTNKLRLLTSAKVNGTIPVHKYESELTGLRVVLAQVEGPLVNGYFTLGKRLFCLWFRLLCWG